MTVENRQTQGSGGTEPTFSTSWTQPLPRTFLFAGVVTILSVLAAVVLARWRFGFDYAPTGVALDTLLLFPVTWLAILWIRGPVRLVMFAMLLAATFVLSHAVKLAFLGMPVSLADIGPGISLLHVLSGWRLTFALTGSMVYAGTLVWALWPRRGRARFVPLLAIYAAMLYWAANPVSDMLQGPGPEAGLASLREHGGVLALLRNTRGNDSKNAPSRHDVARILRGQTARDAAAPQGPRRNLYLFLLEAYWDPLKLRGYSFSRDPWDPRFRALWKEGGKSAVLSPVFGGATANAEFEVLCGLPAEPQGIDFQDDLDQAVPCLPRVLREAGYLTVASHPYQSGYWNRAIAYRRIGFERYDAIGTFVLDDMDGLFLNDGSTFRQISERLDARSPEKPLFSYVVSLSTHYPYGRNITKRPDLVTVTPSAPLLQAYANNLAYSSRALMDYLQHIRIEDPDALIVAFGDHAPVLGFNPDPYANSEMKLDESMPADRLAEVSETPLIVIDGERGAVSMGALPLYALPGRILSLLRRRLSNLPYLADDSGDRIFLRRFLGRTIVNGKGGWTYCKHETVPCATAKAREDRLSILKQDLLEGHQYSLDSPQGRGMKGESTMKVTETYGECSLQVEAWGPKQSQQGRGFTVQPDGASAIWMRLRSGRGVPELVIGNDRAKVTIDGKRGSATFRNPGFLNHVGPHDVRWECGPHRGGDLGTFLVTNPPGRSAGKTGGDPDAGQ